MFDRNIGGFDMDGNNSRQITVGKESDTDPVIGLLILLCSLE